MLSEKKRSPARKLPVPQLDDVTLCRQLKLLLECEANARARFGAWQFSPDDEMAIYVDLPEIGDTAISVLFEADWAGDGDKALVCLLYNHAPKLLELAKEALAEREHKMVREQKEVRRQQAQQLREAADILERNLSWRGTRTLSGGQVQEVGSHYAGSHEIDPLTAIGLGYTITALREQASQIRSGS